MQFKTGDLIDQRYSISGPLGQGGMAHVYRAHDRHLDREVALKILRPHLTEMDQERFRREIKTLARLSHPGIVSIYDLGRGDTVYFAMELVEGGMFTDLGPLEPDLEPLLGFLEAAVSVAEALAYVHHHGMVHRDLTPRNILLTEQGQPKVMDFGLVQLAEATRQLTRTGFTLGTPHYMAPEQAKGDATGAHTDLYALGAVFYRAVTGDAPFEAENDQAVLYQHVYSTLVPPRERNPHVPRALSRLIESMLEKDPAERPSSGYRIAEALRSIRAHAEQLNLGQRLGGPAQGGKVAHGPVQPERLRPLWRVQLEEGPQWPAALTAAEGFLLLGLRSEQVAVLRPADGAVQALFEAEDEVNSPVTFQEGFFKDDTPVPGRLHYTSRNGGLYCLGWPEGNVRYAQARAGALGLVPYAEDLIVSFYNGLKRLNPEGETVWHYEAGHAATAPSLHRGYCLFMTRDGTLHSLEAKTGQAKFKVHIGNIVAQPAAKDGIVLLPEREGDLHAFSLETHENLWTYDTEGPLWASPVVWGPYAFVVSWSGTLHCLSLKTGDDIWAYPLKARVTATPVLASGILYIVTEEGEVLAFDARRGSLLFRDRVSSSPLQASPLLLSDTLIVAALDGTVQAYR